MTTIHIPAGAKSPANRLAFEVENSDGEVCEFSIPKRGYYTRKQIKAMDEAGAKAAKLKLSEADQLVTMLGLLVEQTDPTAAEFLRADNIENQQVEAIWAAYTAADEDGDVTEGESVASSTS